MREADAVPLKALDSRSADVMRLGEDVAEHEHALDSKISYPVVYRGRKRRDAQTGGFFQLQMKNRERPACSARDLLG